MPLWPAGFFFQSQQALGRLEVGPRPSPNNPTTQHGTPHTHTPRRTSTYFFDHDLRGRTAAAPEAAPEAALVVGGACADDPAAHGPARRRPIPRAVHLDQLRRKQCRAVVPAATIGVGRNILAAACRCRCRCSCWDVLFGRRR